MPCFHCLSLYLFPRQYFISTICFQPIFQLPAKNLPYLPLTPLPFYFTFQTKSGEKELVYLYEQSGVFRGREVKPLDCSLEDYRFQSQNRLLAPPCTQNTSQILSNCYYVDFLRNCDEQKSYRPLWYLLWTRFVVSGEPYRETYLT